MAATGFGQDAGEFGCSLYTLGDWSFMAVLRGLSRAEASWEGCSADFVR